MSFKIIGAIFVIVGCGGFGFMLAASNRREEKCLRQFMSALEYMECELQYRLTPLPELCRQAAKECNGAGKSVFLSLAGELDGQLSPDVERCMLSVLSRTNDLPQYTLAAMKQLGHSLGQFDIDGQLKELSGIREECRRNLEALTNNQAVRLRSYQTLGLCAGAAMAILFI